MTLQVHKQAINRQEEKNAQTSQNYALLVESPNADDDRAELPETEIEAEENAQMSAATVATSGSISQQEWDLLEQMSEIAQNSRYEANSKVKALLEWVRKNLCLPPLTSPPLGENERGPGAKWRDRRVLIFTEYTDTKRYLQQQLQDAIAGSEQENERIDCFTGGMGDERREAIKRAFNTNPKDHPLRILIATDAAREGVNLQNYRADLFHFDIPWNPSRMEQRNGRIDRKLQREPVVRCHYFVLPQRTEDRVLEVLINKTKTIVSELGSLSPVIEKNVSQLLDDGIEAKAEQILISGIETAEQADESSKNRQGAIREELETVRPEIRQLRQQEEGERGRQGEGEMGREKHLVTLSPCHLVTLSPCYLVTLSPCHLVTLSPCVHHVHGNKKFGNGAKKQKCVPLSLTMSAILMIVWFTYT